jgi:hypothetical protein
MFKKYLFFVVFLCVLTLIFSLPATNAKSPKGAKAIFDSGEGPSVGMSVGHAPKPSEEQPVKKEKYTGISYKLVLLSDDGQFKVVPKSRAFKSGEKIKMLVRTNRSGYLTIYNVGSSGKTNLLFNDYVDAFTINEIPKNTNFRFVGAPGSETLLVMLSDNPNPIKSQPPMMASAPPPPPADAPPSEDTPPSSDEPPPADASPAADMPPDADTPTSADMPPPADYAAPPPSSDLSALPSVASLVLSIAGAKSIKGSKDIVAEDSMQNSYAVISPKNGWKPVKGGMKDIVLESSDGSNYGVIPASAIADGGILTLEIKLKHK